MTRILPMSFALLTYSGYWRPVDWPLTSIKYRLYNVYSLFMMFLLHSFAFCGLIDCITIGDLEIFLEKFTLSLSVIATCCKVLNLVVRRDDIVGLTEMLLKDICLPRDNHEMDIQRRFDRSAKMITIYCGILNESTVFIGMIVQFIHVAKTRTLPLSDWVPYDITPTTVFWATAMHQIIALIVCANASVAHETLISGFMVQTCGQLDILCHRARTLPDTLKKVAQSSTNISKEDLRAQKQQLIREFVHHHRYVFRLAERVNAVFALMIFVQFTVSSTVLCLSVYKMSKKSLLSFEFAYSLTYLGCMLMQIYLYCWFGNEVTLKSGEVGSAIYEMDWTMLSVDLMKNILMIGERSRRTIRITSGYLIALSNESFMKIIKISYSAYNLLKDT